MDLHSTQLSAAKSLANTTRAHINRNGTGFDYSPNWYGSALNDELIMFVSRRIDKGKPPTDYDEINFTFQKGLEVGEYQLGEPDPKVVLRYRSTLHGDWPEELTASLGSITITRFEVINGDYTIVASFEFSGGFDDPNNDRGKVNIEVTQGTVTISIAP
ncbi:hypothetical protein [Pseudomonas helleri]|uniref:hypothetical protein n=1 Tax=Pseudomonas helleri TaxID=1608996 RepID=UPI0038073ACF